MRVVVAGGCGFVGASLIRHLRARIESFDAIAFDNLSRPGSEYNARQLQAEGIKVVRGDTRSPSDLAQLPACEWVIDAAANASVLAGVDGRSSAKQLFETNLIGSINLLETCRQNGSGLVLLSTSRVYSIDAMVGLPMAVDDGAFVLDSAKTLPAGASAAGLSTEFSTAAPISLYGASKLASEQIVLEYGQAFDFPVWVNRCGVLAGAGQFGTPGQGIFAFWLHSFERRRPLRYIGFDGTGCQSRDALHPADLADLIYRQLQSDQDEGGRTFTVGGGPTNLRSLAQLTAWCGERFGSHEIGVDAEPRKFDVPWVAMDSSAAAARFDWRVERPIDSILEEIAAHAEKHPEWLDLSRA